MASPSTDSINVPSIIHEKSAAFVTDFAACMEAYAVQPGIELFDLSHMHGARRLIGVGLMDDHPHGQIVMGIRNTLPMEEHVPDMRAAKTRQALPRAIRTAVGIGVNQARVMGRAARDGDMWTRLEHNVRVNRARLASSSDGLVQLAAEYIGRRGCRPAMAAGARAMLGLDAAASAGC